MAAAHVLYDDEEIRVVHHPGSSGFSLVTFGSLTDRAEGTRFWGDKAAGKLDLHAIGFMPKRENWYPMASVARAAAAVRAVLRPEAVGYGFSMGGYAALKHGGLLGLTHALAVSPQATIDPAEVPQEPSYHRHFRPELHAGMRLVAADLPPFSALVADQYDPADGVHAELAAAAGPLHRIPLPFLGHGTIQLLAGSEALDTALRHVRGRDAAGLRRFLRARRQGSQAWHKLLGRAALARGKDAMAERLWQRGLALGLPPATLALERALGTEARVRRLLRQGAGPRAVALAAALAATAERRNAAVLPRLASLLHSHGHSGEAALLFRRALALDEGSAAAHRGLVNTLLAAGRGEEALEACRRAALRHPDDAQVALTLGRLLYARQDLAGAEAALRACLRAAAPGAGALAGQAMHALSHVLAQRRLWPEAVELARGAVARLPGHRHATAWFERIAPRLQPLAASP